MEAMRTNTDTAGKSAHPDLRGWLQWLAATGRLAVAREGLSLIDEQLDRGFSWRSDR